MNEYIKILFKSIILSFILFVIFLIILLIIYPTYLSVKNDNLLRRGYNINNIDFDGLYSNGTILLKHNYSIVLRHELCHKWIDEKNIDLPIVLNEITCYTAQWFIWQKVNMTTMDWEK